MHVLRNNLLFSSRVINVFFYHLHITHIVQICTKNSYRYNFSRRQFIFCICAVVCTDCKDLIRINTNVISKYESAKRSRSTEFSIVELIVVVDGKGRRSLKGFIVNAKSAIGAALSRRDRLVFIPLHYTRPF